MKARLQRFMAGRYGPDQFGRFANILALALLVLGMFYAGFYFLGLILMVYQYFRMFSRNVLKREQENMSYLQLKGRAKGWFLMQKSRVTQRRTHMFFKCPGCGQTLRAPKGKGKLSITCPKCKTSFYKDS